MGKLLFKQQFVIQLILSVLMSRLEINCIFYSSEWHLEVAVGSQSAAGKNTSWA